MPDDLKERSQEPKGPHLYRAAQSPRIYICLGANLGDRESNLSEAQRRIEELGCAIIRASSLYETEPVGLADQPWFLNQVIEVRADSGFDFSPDGAAELLGALLRIERRMGRRRTVPDGPRIIDIDLLLFGEMIIDANPLTNAAEVKITVPHPRMHLRRFVLEPLCEIAPRLVHPQIGRTIGELLAEVEDASTVRLYKGDNI
ncbi:MAG: 2-amino-4-hydroxy-6-hydroxymethyldihydropteridine diphosphokinase [Blastocatellia bacterium]|nr:2-amino-4-hydroxy-6-hydroxymethyldihydropteridine diphosphokinase [Blastocatellia bacterium]